MTRDRAALDGPDGTPEKRSTHSWQGWQGKTTHNFGEGLPNRQPPCVESLFGHVVVDVDLIIASDVHGIHVHVQAGYSMERLGEQAQGTAQGIAQGSVISFRGVVSYVFNSAVCRIVKLC